MKDDYIREYCNKVYGQCADTDMGIGFVDGAKWGIKEVVEWEKEICSDRSHHSSEYMEKRYCNACRMFKLAEWGIDG